MGMTDEDVTWLLVAAGACEDAISQLGHLGRAEAIAAATASDRDWAERGEGRGYGSGTGFVLGCGDGYMTGSGDGFGDGSRGGSGYGSTDGSGYGGGSVTGLGLGDGWARIELADGTVLTSRAQAREMIAQALREEVGP